MLLEAGERRRAIDRRQMAMIVGTAHHKPENIEKVTPFAPASSAVEDVGPMADDGTVTFDGDDWWEEGSDA